MDPLALTIGLIIGIPASTTCPMRFCSTGCRATWRAWTSPCSTNITITSTW